MVCFQLGTCYFVEKLAKYVEESFIVCCCLGDIWSVVCIFYDNFLALFVQPDVTKGFSLAAIEDTYEQILNRLSLTPSIRGDYS